MLKPLYKKGEAVSSGNDEPDNSRFNVGACSKEIARLPQKLSPVSYIIESAAERVSSMWT
jgi:hypothetical protein